MPTTIPTIDHPTNRPNFAIVEVNGTSYAFSYKTLIAFRGDWGQWTARENVWGPTTGKHLNAISPSGRLRYSETEFTDRLNAHHKTKVAT